MPATILGDADVGRLLPMADAVGVIEDVFRYQASGALEFEPRFSFDSGIGSLKFTVGAVSELLIIGSRVAGKFPANPGESVDFEVETPVKADMTVVFDVAAGEPAGAVRGSRLADVRTGALGGVAVDRMARADVSTLGVVGTGRQATVALEAALAVRAFDDVRAYSRSRENREAFAAEMSERVGQSVRAVDSAEAAVRGADVVATTTTAPTPVVEAEWLAPGAHLNVVGPLFEDAHEVGTDVFERAGTLATDSVEQLDAYGERYFLAGTRHRERMIELKDVVAGERPGRADDEELTVFCPIGLPGTEVVLAHEALARAAARRPDETA